MTLNRLGQGTSLVRGRLVAAGAVLVALAGSAIWMGSRVQHGTTPSNSQVLSTDLAGLTWHAESGPVLRTSGQLPLMFEPNVGQTDPRVKFMARGSGYGLFLTADEAVLSFADRSKTTKCSAPSVVRMRLSGAASSASIAGAEELPGKSNYLLGNDPAKWHRNVPQFASVRYEGVYPGVDLVYYGNQGQLEYDFAVAPGADPKVVRLAFDGAENVALDSGELTLSTATGSVRLHAPRVYQVSGSQQQTVDARFVLLAQNEVGFAVGDYDHARTLVIDPVLTYSTYLGGTKSESAPQIAVDSGFNFYVVGTATSPDFPIPASPPTPFQATLNGGSNVFVAKFNATGSALLFATYLGGTGLDTAQGVSVDAASNVYVAGTTTSTDFPTSASAFQQKSKSGSGQHTFVTQLLVDANSQNQTLGYSTYLSGSGIDTMSGITTDSAGLIYVIGTTNSNDFPIAPSQGALQNNLLGNVAFFVSKLNPTQTGTSSLVYSTYFGGIAPANAVVTGGGIAIDNNSTGSNIFITGGTNFQFNGNANDFPIKNAWQGCLDRPGNNSGACDTSLTKLDAFVAKINPANTSGAQLIYCTYVGGTGDDVANGIGVDSSGNAYITGSTTSTEPVSQIASNAGLAYSTSNAGLSDAFVAKVTNPVAGGNQTNVVLGYFSYLGGSGDDSAQAIAVDSVQGARIVGTTNSMDLAPFGNAVQPTFGGGATDAFVARLDTTTSKGPGTFVSYLGGSGSDRGTGIAVDSDSVTYVAGDTMSQDFPTAAPFQAKLKGNQNAFAAKLGPSVSLTLQASQSGASVNAGNQATFTYIITNKGDTTAGVAFIDDLSNQGLPANFVSATVSGGTCPTAPTNNTILCNVGVLNGGATSTVTVVVTPTTSGVLSNAGKVIVAGSSFFATASASLSVDSYTLDVQPPSQTVTAGNPATFTPTLTPQGPKGTYSANIALTCSSGLPSGVSCTFSTSPVTLSNQSPSSVTLTMNTTARTTTTAGMQRGRPLYAIWLPIGGLALFGAGMGKRNRKRAAGGLLALLVLTLVAFEPACSHSSSTTLSSGTPAGTYAITVSATSGSFSQTHQIQLVVQ